MINTTLKGRRLERRVAKILEGLGEEIIFRSVRTRFQSIDFYNAFDLISLKPSVFLRFVQVKSNGNPDRILDGLIKKIEKMPIDRAYYEVWVYKGNNIWKIAQYNTMDRGRMTYEQLYEV